MKVHPPHDMGKDGIDRPTPSIGPAIGMFLWYGEKHLQKRKIVKKSSILANGPKRTMINLTQIAKNHNLQGFGRQKKCKL